MRKRSSRHHDQYIITDVPGDCYITGGFNRMGTRFTSALSPVPAPWNAFTMFKLPKEFTSPRGCMSCLCVASLT